MAISLRELPWYTLLLLFAALAVVLILVGEYAPFLPVKKAKSDLAGLQDESRKLAGEVSQLQVMDRRYAEFRAEMEALRKQLEILRAIVPEEKEVDEFIRLVQGAASSSNVAIRRMTARPVSTREYHNEVPFEVEVDGPYYAVLDFFARIGRLSRIINVGDLSFSGISEQRGRKYPVLPGTTVTGTFTATTFFTKGAEEAARQAAKQPGKR